MQRYSVDLHPKKEEAQIPLSTVDGEVFDSTPVKGTCHFKNSVTTGISLLKLILCYCFQRYANI